MVKKKWRWSRPIYVIDMGTPNKRQVAAALRAIANDIEVTLNSDVYVDLTVKVSIAEEE